MNSAVFLKLKKVIMRKSIVFYALMLTVTAGLYSCGSMPSTATGSKADDQKDVNVVIVSPTTGEVTQMSGKELNAYLDDWKQTTAANFSKGTQYYTESHARMYWVKKHNTRAMFGHFPDKWIGINYHAYGFKGVQHGNMTYTICTKDSVGEICFVINDVTNNVTETENWKNNMTDEHATLIKAVAAGCSMEEDDLVFKKQVLPVILSEMKQMKIKIDGQLTPAQITSAIQEYTKKKTPAEPVNAIEG